MMLTSLLAAVLTDTRGFSLSLNLSHPEGLDYAVCAALVIFEFELGWGCVR